MTSQQLNEEQIFHNARDITDPARRRNYLEQVCDGDASLRERIQALLDVHEQETGFLKSNTAEKSTADVRPGGHSINEQIGPQKLIHLLGEGGMGTVIGRYKLMEQIGEGGMGTVFVAEQARPIRRKVALKVIKPGMDSKAVGARFEAERQALP